MKQKSNKFNRGRVLNVAAIICAAVVLAILPVSMLVNASGNAAGSVVVLTRTANLVSPTGSVNPHGDATYEVYDSGQRELEIEAEDVNAADGTLISFFVDGNNVGQIALSQQRAKLRLKTELGQAVPTVNAGSTVAVRNGATTILTGTFNAGTGSTPSPSVSPSPSGSPTTSPSASPSGSPSASPSVSPSGSPSPSPSISPSPSPSGSPSPSPSPNAGDLFAALTGATVSGVLPNGFAQYELHSSRTELEIRVRQVNLPSGTALTVSIVNSVVGQLTLESGGEGRLRLRSDNGQNVPVITAGTSITLKSGAATILSGTFAGGTTPSPSPSGSPSPSPSQTPNQGRYFETHLTGNQVAPPVSTAATGEVKVFLNQTETQATITGEFHNLSSAQTSAKIVLNVGDSSVVYTFPVIGGTNGRFPNATVAVSAAQIAQLRTGLWTAVIASTNFPNGEIQGRLTTHSNHSDFDGDGSSDIAVFRPSSGIWYVQNSEGFSARAIGGANDRIMSGDFDGDGKTDAAVFRNVGGAGVWSIKRSSDAGTTETQFGLAADVPVRGDFDGDGRNDLAVYRPSSGAWYIQPSNNSALIGLQFGVAEDIPAAVDFDGDGVTDIAVFRPSNGTWYYLRSSDGGFRGAHFGQNGDVPLNGDFDGDGKADLAVFRPSNGAWYILRSSDGAYDFRQFGLNGDVPVAGNYDGDGATDIAVFRPSNGVWYIWRSLDNAFSYQFFGQAGDVPTPAR